ncbi:hypothetical protein C8R46DRAFT_658505 [Mycena filopes]|nr:hypothetical protein C8R46DRAFT_658505 [Mycena filopes]
MHRSWQIPEVVDLICGVADFPTLAALAQTCQAFQPPALALLWEKQTDFLRLLKCMPSDVWELETINKPGPPFRAYTKVKFLRPVMPSDWTRVIFYAAYVKSFAHEGPTQPPGHPMVPEAVTWEVYATLCVSLPTQPLFPNLRHLTWKTQDDVFPYFRMLAGKRLRSIIVNTHGSHVVRASLLPALTTFHPKLTHLEFDHIHHLPESMVVQAIYTAIRSLNHLETLKSLDLDLPSLLHVAQLPNLGSLHLQVFPDLAIVNEFVAQAVNMGPVFGPLRELTTYTHSTKHIIGFLDAIDPDALEKIDVGIQAPVAIHDWAALITTMAHKASETLTKVSLKEGDDNTDIEGGLALTLPTDCLQPLLACSNLTEVTVTAVHCIDIDDAFIKLLALAWPRLEKLDLSPRHQSEHYEPKLTLAGLIPLAQYCQSLASLAIVMDATVADAYARDKPGGGITNLALVAMEVVESPLSSPEGVASFLSAIFPNLRRVTTRELTQRHMDTEEWDANEFQWDRVNALVRVIASARAQEQRGAA